LITHLHVFFRDPESFHIEKWYGKYDRRQRTIVQALHEHFTKDGNLVEQVSVSMRRVTHRCGTAVLKAQIFQRSGELLRKERRADWTEFGGHTTLHEFLHAEFGWGYKQ
jgi:hypothetical protein